MSGKLALREFFTRPPLPSTGVSIHRHAVAVACTRRTKGKLLIQRAAVEPLPAGVIEPAFDGVNIKNRDALGEALGRALTSAGLKRRSRWCMALPAAACRMFLLDLDEVPSDAEELAQILEWKAERFLGMAASELVLACERIMSGPTGGRFLVVAVRTEVLTAYESVLAGLGLHPGWVVPVPIAESGWLFHSATEGDSLLVSYEDELVTFVFARRDTVLAVRAVPCSPDALLDEIHRTLAYYQDKLRPASAATSQPRKPRVSLWRRRRGVSVENPSSLAGEATDVASPGDSPSLDLIVLVTRRDGRDTNAEATWGPSFVAAVTSLCRKFFPDDHSPRVYSLDEEKVNPESPLTLSSLAAAVGITLLG
ncbi:MAG TPA: pilus assembly protein PilM [Blastocatellia bacterium]|nr:pilus assembly protein PilM [Blastocatellia bacterium]